MLFFSLNERKYKHLIPTFIYPNIKSYLLIFSKKSLIEIRLQKSNIMLCVDNKIRCVYIIAFKHPLKKFRLMHHTFLHKVNYFILNSNKMLHPIVELTLHFIF